MPKKKDKEGKNMEGKTTANLEGTARITYIAKIKRKTRGEAEVKKRKWKLVRRPFALGRNGFATMINRKNKMKWVENCTYPPGKASRKYNGAIQQGKPQEQSK